MHVLPFIALLWLAVSIFSARAAGWLLCIAIYLMMFWIASVGMS